MVLGMNEPENLRIIATTVKEGDPGYAGSLAGISLGIPSYHLMELKPEIPDETWREQMAMKELEIPDEVQETIVATMRDVRGED